MTKYVRNGVGDMIPVCDEPDPEPEPLPETTPWDERSDRGKYGHWLRKFSGMSVSEVAEYAAEHGNSLSYAQIQALHDLNASVEGDGRLAFDERKWVVERLEGRAKEYVEHTGDAGGLTISFGPSSEEVPAQVEGEEPDALPEKGDGSDGEELQVR